LTFPHTRRIFLLGWHNQRNSGALKHLCRAPPSTGSAGNNRRQKTHGVSDNCLQLQPHLPTNLPNAAALWLHQRVWRPYDIMASTAFTALYWRIAATPTAYHAGRWARSLASAYRMLAKRLQLSALKKQAYLYSRSATTVCWKIYRFAAAFSPTRAYATSRAGARRTRTPTARSLPHNTPAYLSPPRRLPRSSRCCWQHHNWRLARQRARPR